MHGDHYASHFFDEFDTISSDWTHHSMTEDATAESSRSNTQNLFWIQNQVDPGARDSYTSSTAQGGGGSFKNRKLTGDVGCCESRMAARIH